MRHDNVFSLRLCSFFPKLNSFKQSNSINKICNSTQLSKFAIRFYCTLFCFFLFGTAFFISIASLRNLFTSNMFVLFRATFHLRGSLKYLVIFLFYFPVWLLKSYENKSVCHIKLTFYISCFQGV